MRKLTIMRKIIGLLVCILLSGCSTVMPQRVDQPDFMTGSWKVKGAAEYEVWTKESPSRYSAYAYRIKEGEKQIWERMVVSRMSDDWQFAASVPDQNEGQAIIFKLVSNPAQQGEWLFVNEEHDFPKRILYKRIEGDLWIADVRGADGKGFKVTLVRQ